MARRGAQPRAWLVLLASAVLGAGCGWPNAMPVLVGSGTHLRVEGRTYRPLREQDEAARRREIETEIRQLLARSREARARLPGLVAQIRDERARQGDVVLSPDSEPQRRHADSSLLADARRDGSGAGSSKRSRRRPRATAGRARRYDGDDILRRKPVPPGKEPVDHAVAERELVREVPWLRALSNHEDIIALYALRILWTREARYAARQYSASPDPARTIVSAERAKRMRQRERWEDRRLHAARILHALPNRTPIDLRDLRASDWFRASTNIERAARWAAFQEIERRHECTVWFDFRGETFQVYVYIDGTHLRLRDGKVHFDEFFRPGLVEVPLLEVQLAYYEAIERQWKGELHLWLKSHPWIAGVVVEERLEEMIAADRMAAVSEEIGVASPEARQIEAMRRERLSVAKDMRLRAAAAMVPFAVLARFFAIEGAADLFIAVFPAGKAAEAIQGLAKARRLRKLRKADHARLIAATEPGEAQLLNRVSLLSPGEVKALLAIRTVKHVGEPELVALLAAKASKGHVDLAWLNKMLKDGNFDGAFVANFTRYDANPSWRDLKRVLDNTIAPASRGSFMSKLTGFLGEEGAERYVKEILQARFLGKGKEFFVTRGDKHLDVFARTDDKMVMIFGEVKNWSEYDTLLTTGSRKLRDQLVAHNQRIEDILQGTKVDLGEPTIHKFLMVGEDAWKSLDNGAREELKTQIKGLGGWTVEVIPERLIETEADFIDRLRKSH